MNYYMRDGSPAPGKDHMEQMLNWSRAYENADRHVGSTTIGHLWVSTVYLGLDHSFGGGPPLIFETMVFDHSDGETSSTDLYCERWSTEAEALAGHNAVVERIIKGTFTNYMDEPVDTTYRIEEVPTLT